MKDKFQKVLDDYYDKKISLDDFIYHIQYLHREKFRIDSKDLKKELHPKLQEILPQLIKKVEKKTNLVYYGIYDDFEDRKIELKHYMIRFQHKFYFSLYIELSFGQSGSKGSGEYEEMYIHDDNKVHLCISTPSCQAVWCECDLDDKNLLKEILSAIIKFNEDYTY